MAGEPIAVSTRAKLLAAHRKLLAHSATRGTPLYAATFLRQRKIVLEAGLFEEPCLARLILTHELFHFVWVRLANAARHQFSHVIADEIRSRARGEIGESAGVRKELTMAAACRLQGRMWRDYVCESFCDTAAWLYAGVEDHQSFQLANRWRRGRATWFRHAFSGLWSC